MLPAALLALAWQEQEGGPAWRFARISLGATACIGLLLAASDWLYADVYRREARAMQGELTAAAPGAHVFFRGHWGWQWYATKAGFTRYDPGSTQLGPGDLLVWPELVHKLPLKPGRA